MSLLPNATYANPTTPFFGGGGPTPVPGGNSLQSPASIIPSVIDDSSLLSVAATPATAANATLNVTASGSGTGSLNVTSSNGPASVSVTGPSGATVNVLSPFNTTIDAHTTGADTATILSQNTGTGNAVITATSSADSTISAISTPGGGPNTATVSASNTSTGTAEVLATSTSGPAAMTITSGGVGAATLGINASGSGAVVVSAVATAGNTTMNLESTGNTELNIIGPNSVLQIGGDVGGAVTPGFFNGGDGVIRLSNNLSNPDQPSEVLTADVVGATLKVKGLGGAPQVLLASQNIAPGNVTPTTFTIPNPTGEGLYSIMAASSTVGGPSTQNSRDAQFSMMAYVNSAGRIQIGGNGGTTVGAVGGGQSLEIYPLDGTTNLFMTYNGTQQLNNMSVVAFNISGPIPSAF